MPIPPDVSRALRVMLYDEDSVPTLDGNITRVDLPGLRTVLMLAAGDGIMRTVDRELRGSWGDIDEPSMWDRAIANSREAEQAQVQSFADRGMPQISAVISNNRVAGTLLSVRSNPALCGSNGAVVAYPHKDMFLSHQVEDPNAVQVGVLLWVAAKMSGADPQAPQTMWWAHAGGFEPLEARMESGRPRVKAGPLFNAACGARTKP